MTPSEIRELIAIMDWDKPRLASEMDLSEMSIHRWVTGKNEVNGPAAVLMRVWLEQARTYGPDAVLSRSKLQQLRKQQRDHQIA